MVGWRTMTYQLLSEDGGNCGTYPTYQAAVQHALYGVNQFHNTYSIIDLDEGEEIITIGGTHE